MQWLDRLTGKKPNDADYLDAPRDSFPLVFGFANEKLLIRIYHHRVRYPPEAVHCWTYVTAGMWRYGQKDIVLSLRCLPEEMANDPLLVPKRPASFLHSVCKLAMQGNTVDLGGYSEFAEPGAVVGDFKGTIYVEAQYAHGVTLPHMGALAAILVYEEELELVTRGGATSITARLGREKLYFPVPFWSDRTRPPLPVLQETLAKSVHLTTPTGFMRASAVLQDNVVTLQLPRLQKNQFAQLPDLEPHASFTLTLQPDPAAEGCLVWSPDGNPVNKIMRDSSPGMRTSGCFIGFTPKDDGRRTLGIVEDGFILHADIATVLAVREALYEGRPLHAKGFDVYSEFRIEWFEPSFVRLPYPRPLLQPTPEDLGRPDVLPGPALISNPIVALYTLLDDVSLNIGSDPFNRFLAQIDRTLCDVIAPLPRATNADLVIYITVYESSRFIVLVSVRGPDQATNDALNPHIVELGQRLEALEGPALKIRQPITFAYVVGIGAASGKPLLTVF